MSDRMKQSASLTVGPFFRIGLIYGGPQNDLVNEQTAGECITLTGVIFDGDGEPIPDALIEIWQPDANGIFNHPLDPLYKQADPHFRGFGRAETRDAGKYEFKTVKPGERDGEAPHINMHIFGRGMLIQAFTRVYFSDEPTTAKDSALNAVDPARRHTLIATREQSDGPPVYRFDIRMQGEDETVFFNP